MTTEQRNTLTRLARECGEYSHDDVQHCNDVMAHDPIALTDKMIGILSAEDEQWGSRSMDFGAKALEAREAAIKSWAREQKAQAEEHVAAAQRSLTSTGQPAISKEERHKALEDWYGIVKDLVLASGEEQWKTAFARWQTNALIPGKVTSWVMPLVVVLNAVRLKNETRNETIKSLEKRVEELATRCKTLEEAPRGLDYKGTWQRAASYSRNQGVTWDGSIWVCLRDHIQSQPNQDLKNWQLAVRHGQDKS